MNRYARCLLWSVVAMIPLSVAEVMLDISRERLGPVGYWVYMTVSTALLMALVWRLLEVPKSSRRPSP